MTKSCRHKRNKQKLMQYSFGVCQNYSGRGHFRSTMGRKTKLMQHMAVDFNVGTCRIEMTWLEMEDCWILQIGEVMHPCIIIVLVLTNIMIVIVITLTGRGIGDTFHMNLRKKSHLLLMDT